MRYHDPGTIGKEAMITNEFSCVHVSISPFTATTAWHRLHLLLQVIMVGNTVAEESVYMSDD